MALGIAHRDQDRVVLDCVVEHRPPFSPQEVVAEFTNLLHTYGISLLEGDRYASLWPREQFQQRGITYRVAQHTKSELYSLLVPLVTSGRCELLDQPRLIAQLVDLERRVTTAGREMISHGPGVGARDDVSNVAAGCLAAAQGRRGRPAFAGLAEYLRDHPEPPKPEPPAWTAHEVTGGLALPAPRSTLACAGCGRADDGSSGWFVYPSVTCPRCQIRRPDEA
jgi:hypothetical protein